MNGGLPCLGFFLAGVLAVLMATCVEIAIAIVVLLTMWRAGAPTMKSNGKSRPQSSTRISKPARDVGEAPAALLWRGGVAMNEERGLSILRQRIGIRAWPEFS